MPIPINKTRKENFFKTWSPEMAYVLGFFAADGNMIRTKRRGHYISFEITDFELLESIKKILEVPNVISIRHRGPHWKPIYRLQIGSKCMYEDLLTFGFTPRKSLTLAWPHIPKNYLADFIRGYFDGDGCVHFGKYWRKDRQQWKFQLSTNFTSGSRLFLQELWRQLGLSLRGGHISKKERGYELVFGQHDSVALFKFMYNNDTELFLKRKYKKFQYAFQELELRW